MPKSTPFPPSYFRFLKDLKQNNDRDWFRENKKRYEDEVKEPSLAFVAAFGPPLRRVAPRFVADPRPVGGSMFRIFRDTRFSHDKSPYKTHVGLHFRHEVGKDVHAPGFYLHLEPGNVFTGAGIWRPDTKTQRAVREAMVDDPKAWKRATSGKAFDATVELVGESLKRPPRGFDADHPLVEDLKRKDYLCVANLTQKDAAAPDFADRVVKTFRASVPLVKFLCRALDLEY